MTIIEAALDSEIDQPLELDTRQRIFSYGSDIDVGHGKSAEPLLITTRRPTQTRRNT